MAELEHNQWSGKTDGTPFMQRALIWLIRHTSVRVPYAIMALVVPFYMLFHHKGYMAIYRFMRQRIGYKPLKAFVSVYRNHYAFGKVVIDRFAAYAGKKYHFTQEGSEIFEELSNNEAPFLMLSSHVGCYEMSGYMNHLKEKKINVLVYSGESETVMRNRNKIFVSNNISMIPVSADMSHLFEINSALNHGEIVSMPADRIFGSSKFVECKFFGDIARFPAGAFSLARTKKCRMIAVFAMKTGTYKYHFITKEVGDAQQFANVLENVVRQYPLQWFNYFDFWNEQ